jgi:hypothetical protein
MRYLTTIGDKTYVIEINQDDEVIIDGERRALDMRPIDDELYSLLLDNRSFEVLVEEAGDGEYRVLINGRRLLRAGRGRASQAPGPGCRRVRAHQRRDCY